MSSALESIGQGFFAFRRVAQYFLIRWLTAFRAAADILPRFFRGFRSIVAAGSDDRSI
jgi:hypothetical protein